MPKKFNVTTVKNVSQGTISKHVRAAICREMAIGSLCRMSWVPSEDPHNLTKNQWNARGRRIVKDLQGSYPNLEVSNKEIRKHFSKTLGTFRKFLVARIIVSK